MKIDIKTKILIGVVIIGLLTSVFVVVNRIYFDNANKYVDILVKYEDWQDIDGIKKFGVSAISIPVDSLKLLQEEGKLSVFSGGELENIKTTFGKFREITVDINKTYIFSTNEKLLNSVKNFLGQRYQCIRNLQKDNSFLEVNARKDEIYEIGIGFDSEKINRIQQTGCKVVLRFVPDRFADDVWAKLIFESVDDWNVVYGVLFEGDEVFGYGNTGSDVFRTLLSKTNVKIINVEFAKVRGISNFQKGLVSRVVRAHCIEDNVLRGMSVDDALYRFRRAIEERNIRVIYLRPLPVSYDENIGFIKKIKSEIEDRGYIFFNVINKPTINYSNVPVIITFIIAVSVMAICLFIVPVSYVIYIIMVAIMSILCIGLLLLDKTVFVQKNIAFIGALFFPVVAVHFGIVGKGLKFAQGNNFTGYLWLLYDVFIKFIKITVFSIAGGVLINSLLNSEDFIKYVNIFSGVKLANSLPILFVGYYLYLNNKREFNIFLDRNIRVRHIIFTSAFIIFVTVTLTYLLLRTGNVGGKLFLGEDRMRLFLENNLIVRPRIKEFLIGHPLLFLGLAMYHYAKQEKSRLISLLLIIFGIIGQVSIINTFCHIHTPFVFSFVRTLNGILIGCFLGSIVVVLWKLIYSNNS